MQQLRGTRLNWRRWHAGGFSALLFLLAFTGCLHNADAKTQYPREVARVTFAAAGDVIPHQAIYQVAAAHAEGANVAAPATPARAKADASSVEPAPAPMRAAPQAATAAAPDATSPPPAIYGNHGWDYLFSGVADVFRQVDFGFVNLETPVAPVHSRGTKPFMFNAPVDLLQALKNSGINIVSFANNHVMDQGQAGFAETLQELRSNGMLFDGAGDNAQDAWKPTIVEKNGIKVGFLGMTRWLNGNRNPAKDTDPHVAFFPYPNDTSGAAGMDEAGVLAAVKAAAAECDLLVVTLHWGDEYSPAPRPEDVDFAHKVMENGAAILLGGHPHVLQPIETYRTQDQRDTVIVYSLGNFVSNQSRNYVDGLAPDKSGDPRDEMIVTFSAVRMDYGPAGTRVELGAVGVIPVWGENNHLGLQSGRVKVPNIRPELIDRELPPLQARVDELAKKGDQMSKEEKQEYMQASKELKQLQDRRQLLLQRTGDDYLVVPAAKPEPPSTPTK